MTYKKILMYGALASAAALGIIGYGVSQTEIEAASVTPRDTIVRSQANFVRKPFQDWELKTVKMVRHKL